ncbi:MAG: DUF1844 domain-containing protein [Terracidiphilus sp.]|jgi:hypothetical protein
MSDKPKFEVIDRRKIKADEEQDLQQPSAPVDEAASEPQAEGASAPPQPGAGPRLVVNQPEPEEAAQEDAELPAAPTARESLEQKAAYDASAQRLEDIVRAQNPAAGEQPPVTFENLVQQFYLSAMIQMGAGTPQGQQPRVDILGARTTIDLLAVLADKTRGNLSEAEDNILQSVLFETRMTFLEISKMISLQAMKPPPPPQAKR